VRRAGAQLPEKATILSSKTFSFAGEPFTCWEYLYPVHHPPPGDYRLIDCSTPDGGFRAWFGGQRRDISDFYKIFDSVKKAE
jgi:hypothetical protein